MSDAPHSTKRLRFSVFILSALGLFLAVVALREHVLHVSGMAVGESFCNLSEHINCEKVNTSEWSVLLGLPVASWGIFFYLTLMALSLLAGMARAQLFSGLAFVAGSVASLVSLSLFAISEFVIGALCLVCVGMYIINFLLLFAALGFGYRWRVGQAVSDGVSSLKRFIRAVSGRAQASDTSIARLFLAWCLIAFGFAVASPRVALTVSAPNSTEVPAGPLDAVQAWKANPVAPIPREIASGALDDHVKGELGAPITIVEFADFECYGCRRLYQEMQPLLQQYEGKYLFVFHHYPLDNDCNPSIGREFHQYACIASRFARCAGVQNAFWPTAEYLFSWQGLETERPVEQVKEQLLVEGVSELGLDGDAIKACMASGKHDQKILSDIALGDKLSIPGTPTIFVNGRMVRPVTPEGLKAIFDSILRASVATGEARK